MGGYSAGLPKGSGGGGGQVIDLTDVVNSQFAEVTLVPSGVETMVISYTVPSVITQLMNTEFGGTNIAKYVLYINNVVKAQFYTWFSGPFNGTWDFRALDNGLLLAEGDVVKVTAYHDRPFSGDFYCRLNMLEITDPPP